MATGSGKTLIMAGLILYLYEKGYRHFLFFVNSTNIIEKTKDNFLNTLSSKYLFAENISFSDNQVSIREVENFQNALSDDINISFNTVQGLHSKLNTPRENALTYDDFESNKMVLISDEAHHINAETKKGKDLSTDDIENIASWEATITRIFNANPENVMLEFTATADLSNPDIARKYDHKLLFDYPLRQFRADGYSKDVQTLQADLPSFDRALQAILLSQYRRKLFEKQGLFIKPVILFKSKTIKESNVFQEEFTKQLKTLSVDTLERLKQHNTNTIIKKVFDYCTLNNISLDNLIEEIKVDFDEDKQISVNSKDESETKQIAINTLEDEDNPYRAIFAVDKLNEGWDVLNLFDIVRLYNIRDAKKSIPGKTTMQEAQLIGRGARYCPFQLDESQPLYRRKFDKDEANEMRICEELYYHASYNPRYIQELNTALIEIGIKPPKTVQRELNIKHSFAQTNFYKSGFIFKNEQKKYNREDIFSLNRSIIEHTHEVKLQTGIVKQKKAFEDEPISETKVETKNKEYQLLDFGERIIRKALNKLDFYRFNNLQKHLPNLQSIKEFINSENYLAKIKINVKGIKSEIENLTPQQKLDIAIDVLDSVSLTIGSDKVEFKGTKEFKPFMMKDIIKNKTLNFALDDDISDKETGRSMLNATETNYPLDLTSRDWYAQTDCFGTSEEKALIQYIDSIYDNLRQLYDDIYLVRNERHFKIFTFDDGRPFEPDFVLFLFCKKENLICQYQIFIEPKGAHLILQDEWKQDFLLQIRKLAKIEQLWQGREYNIWGLPFFNKSIAEQDTKFKEAFHKFMD
jgi:type III restriction enzyme